MISFWYSAIYGAYPFANHAGARTPCYSFLHQGATVEGLGNVSWQYSLRLKTIFIIIIIGVLTV